MNISSALVFGNNEYGQEIAKNVTHKYSSITIFSLEDIDKDDNSAFKLEQFDLSEDWDELNEQYDMDSSIIFCAINEEAKNIFLTISLRSSFKDITIIALAKNNEDANKLKMAGASKVIPIVETTANIITDMLKKPIITEVLHNILYEESRLKIIQVTLSSVDAFTGLYPAEIDWSKKYGVLVLTIVHEDDSHEFIYSSKTKHNYLKSGDVLIVAGYEEDLQNFKHSIGGE